MKRKNVIIISTCSILVLAIIIICIAAFREDSDSKLEAAAPAPIVSPTVVPSAEPTPTQSVWNEKADPTVTPKTEESAQNIGTENDKTQKVVKDDDENTVIDLSGSDVKEPTKEPAPPTPNGDLTDPDKPPTYEPSVPQTSTPTPAPTKRPAESAQEPKPNGSDVTTDGKVYDPVFGWIEVGESQQDIIDSDGDINKQVGNMGGE